MEINDHTVYRCQYCNKTVIATDIEKLGGCFCGSRKVRIAFAVTPEEVEDLKKRGFDFREENFSTSREDAWKPE